MELEITNTVGKKCKIFQLDINSTHATNTFSNTDLEGMKTIYHML